VSKGERVLDTIRTVVDGLAIGLVLVALGTVALARLPPMLGHPVYVVAGPSMAPAIDVGSAVVLESVRPDDLAVGDVVSLRSGPERAVFTHRVTRVAERDGEVWIETRGDANANPDPSLTPGSAVIGRMAVAIPLAGYLIALLSTPAGVVFLIAVGLLLLTLGWWLDGLLVDRLPVPVGAAPPTIASTGPPPAATVRPRSARQRRLAHPASKPVRARSVRPRAAPRPREA
jgi:signal peptidase I